MLDINFIRENKDLIDLAAKKKRLDFNVSDLISLDEDRRRLLQSVEEKRAAQNSYNAKVVAAQGDEKERLIQEMRQVKERLATEEEELKEVTARWQHLMLLVPNVPDVSVPEGDDDAANIEYSVWGTKPTFDFTPKTHEDICQARGFADFERGTKVAGFRGYFLQDGLARLNIALWQFVMDFFSKRDYRPMITPTLINRNVAMGTGYLPQGEDDMYVTQDTQYMAATAEIPVMGYFMDEIVEAKDLPKKVFAFSPCYRREAGSHSKDTRGMFRVHEFFKFEQVALCTANHEESVRLHEELRQNAEEIMQALELPYHVVVNCSGDLGLGQVKKYDIEVWLPGQNRYRETHSISYFHDFQCRRLNIRYRDQDGKMRFAHSLNGTALPTPRALIAILENYQQADGTVKVPTVLQKYMGCEFI